MTEENNKEKTKSEIFQKGCRAVIGINNITGLLWLQNIYKIKQFFNLAFIIAFFLFFHGKAIKL